MTEPWSGGSEHPREALQDLLDGRLSVEAARGVQEHLATCGGCQHEWARLESARSAASTLRSDHDVPADLRTAIMNALDAEDAGAVPARAVSWNWSWVTAGAAAAIALVAVLVWLGGQGRPGDAAPRQAASDFQAVVDSGSLALEMRTAQASELEAFFAGTPTLPRVRVIDLAMMGFTLEGGRRHTLGNAPSALYAYRTLAGERIVCQMYEGRLEGLPPTADVRENNGFTFRVYRDGDLSMVFWQEGNLVCVLVSRLPADEVVKLAFAKAMRPA